MSSQCTHPALDPFFLKRTPATPDHYPLVSRQDQAHHDQIVVPGYERYVKALLVQVLIRTPIFHPWLSGCNRISLGRSCEHSVQTRVSVVDGPVLVGRRMGSPCTPL